MIELILDHSPTVTRDVVRHVTRDVTRDGSITFTVQENENVHERQNSNIRY